jgi:hypothetical protein
VTIGKRDGRAIAVLARTSSGSAARRNGHMNFHTACVVVAMTAEHIRWTVAINSTISTQRINQPITRDTFKRNGQTFCPD